MTEPVFNLGPVSDEEWAALCADPRFAAVEAWIHPSTDTPGVAEHSGSGVTNAGSCAPWPSEGSAGF